MYIYICVITITNVLKMPSTRLQFVDVSGEALWFIYEGIYLTPSNSGSVHACLLGKLLRGNLLSLKCCFQTHSEHEWYRSYSKSSTKKQTQHPSSFAFGRPECFLILHDVLDITVSHFTRARPDQETACVRELLCFLKYRRTLNLLLHNKQLCILTAESRTDHKGRAIWTSLCTNDALGFYVVSFFPRLHNVWPSWFALPAPPQLPANYVTPCCLSQAGHGSS